MSSFGLVFYFLRVVSFAATCKTGCVNGGCNYPGECYCNPGYSGPTCASNTIASGINSCSFSNVTSPCNLANGQLLHDCPSGYSRITSEACPDVPGFDRNICGKTCCDGWTGSECLTRLLAKIKRIKSHIFSLAICIGSCSGNGNCTAANTCVCNAGWTGASCAQGFNFLMVLYFVTFL